MSLSDRLREAIAYAIKYTPSEAGTQLRSLFQPTTLATVASVLAVWGAAQLTGAGEAADVVFLAAGMIFLGLDAFRAANDIGQFAYKTLNAKTEGDLDQAGENLAQAITIIGTDTVITLLTHQSLKIIKGQYRPTITGDPTLPAGTGSTSKFGDITYSTAGTSIDQQLVLYHEQVHSFLSPKIEPFRNFRADLGAEGYSRSSLLKYLEEAIAETYAQLRVNGIKGLPTGIKFPIDEGYVTLSAVLLEAGIYVGTIAIGGITVYYIYVTSH